MILVVLSVLHFFSRRDVGLEDGGGAKVLLYSIVVCLMNISV